jgi:uncharacterized protein YwqG
VTHVLPSFEKVTDQVRRLSSWWKQGASRLGGIPDVAPGFVWPRFQGMPLSLIAQINCAEVNKFDPDGLLPRSGVLHFFYPVDGDQPWGLDPNDKGGAVVLFTPSRKLARADIPPDLEESAIIPSQPVVIRPFASLPPPDSASYESLGLSEDQAKAYEEMMSRLPGDWIPGQPSHFLLGHAHESGGMQLQCQLVTHGLYCGDQTGYEDPKAEELAPAATDWRLLLQIDSDHELNLSFGDAGILHFWIRREDLQQRRFDHTWMTVESC